MDGNVYPMSAGTTDASLNFPSMATDSNVPHVQARFYTRQTQYAVPDTPFSVPANVGVTELSSLINTLLQKESEDGSQVLFDFLVHGELLRVPLETHMQEKGISVESVVEIEYIERHPAPEPEDSLLHDDWVSCVQAAGDFILTGCYDNTLHVSNTEGEMLTTIPAHSGPVKCLAWIKQDDEDPLHVFVSGSHDETLLIWEWNQQRNAVDCVHTCRGHAGSVDCVAVSKDKTRFCSGSWDKMLKIWSAVPNMNEDSSTDEVGEKPQKKKKTDGSKIPTRVPLLTLSGHVEGVSSAVWLSETEVCTASWDHSIRLWDVAQGQHKSTIMGAKVFLNMDFSPLNGLLVTSAADRHVRLYDHRVADGALVKSTFTSHNAWVSCVSWSPIDEHQFISGAYDSLLKLWDTRSPKAPLYDMQGHEDKILACDWSIPQYMLSGGADNHLKIFRCSEKQIYSQRQNDS